MELELKHLAPYLPHQLKVKWGDRIVKMNTGQGSSKYWIGISSVLKWYNSDMIEKPNILLLPMSSLYTEMEDGKVPIVELAKMAGCNINMSKLPINEIETINIAKNNEVEFKYSSGYYRYFIFRNGSFYYKTGHDRRYGQDYEPLKQSSQIELFTYLFEHHFDVFGLIDKGLALDKTKIK